MTGLSSASLAAKLGIEESQLTEVVNGLLAGDSYSERVIQDHVGSRPKTISVPDLALDRLLKNLRRIIEIHSGYCAPDHVYGFVKGRSIRQNAAKHLCQPVVVRVDLRDFFESVRVDRVKPILSQLFGQSGAVIAQICMPNGVLPRGFSTSPILSNIAFEETDRALIARFADDSLNLTRYVDDINLSGLNAHRRLEDLQGILESNNWTINNRKTRVMRRGKPQYVTGLNVASPYGPHVPKRVRDHLRWAMKVIEREGYESYWRDWGGSSRNETPNRLNGILLHIRSVEWDFGNMLIDRLEKIHLSLRDFFEDVDEFMLDSIFEAD